MVTTMSPETKRWVLVCCMLKCTTWERERFYARIAEVCAGINASSAAQRDILYIWEQVQLNRAIVDMLHTYYRGRKFAVTNARG